MAEARTRAARRSRAWLLLVLPDALIVGAVAVGLAAPFLAPRTFWWAQLVAIGLPYATWALAAMTALWIVARWWSVVAMHALLVLLVVFRAGAVDRLSAPPVGDDDLVLTTFNVPQVGPSREVLGDSVVGFVQRARPDLLLLQDSWVFGRSDTQRRRVPLEQAIQVEAVVDSLAYRLEVPARLAGHPGWSRNGTGVPMLVRDGAGVEVIEQEALVLGGERDADVSLAIRTHLTWDGRDAVIYNVHLRSFGEAKPWDDPDLTVAELSTWMPYLRRYREAYAKRGAEVDEIAERVAAETYPVIVVGDFNSTADNWTYRRLQTAGAHRTDAIRAAGGWSWGRTYHAERPFVRIDYVLADPAFEITSAETRRVAFSDHRPVRVTLRWAPDAPPSP